MVCEEIETHADLSSRALSLLQHDTETEVCELHDRLGLVDED